MHINIFILIMVLCVACQKSFKDTRGLTTHLNYCKKSRALTVETLARNDTKFRKGKKAKIIRREDEVGLVQEREVLRNELNEVRELHLSTFLHALMSHVVCFG
jgi:hypothetical protein